jgi:hypothetical protein
MKKLFLILIVTSFTLLLNAQSEKLSLVPDENYPLWLTTNQSRTDQTSGIAFIKSEGNLNYFLLADDIGSIHLLTIKDDAIYNIEKVKFTEETDDFFPTFPKMDFEEITYDKNTGEVYLSVEGNGENFNDYVGIYKLIFEKNNVLTKNAISIARIFYRPKDLFYKYTSWNIGYEGFALDNNYFYLGLEGFQNNHQFSDSTIIFIANKSDMKIIKEVSTKSLGIHTICGLFSDKDYSLWGIDRNSRKIFHISFNQDFSIKDFIKFDCSTIIPGYTDLNYLPSYESITIDNKNNIYLVDDPWREMFVPAESVLEKLDEKTINNFKEFIPTIFKYKIKTEGE